ncbi:hormogonium polysaccharide biosynthesis protein HpsA, partial [Allocoleopsis sp.]|uniref:hormogonium polysaccharide biosynthesis protein HpsA n=1 Tax=Allocoleopsis sp. TaxID=3088169 RepID=UPI002FD01ED4
MSTRKKPNNFVQRLLRRLWRSFNALANALLNWVLRSFRVNKHRSRQSQAGFVLPTVVMVLLVVALLTTAIVIRSFDRSKNASNFRVDQAVLNAATPALDRSRAKIERLFSTEENRLTSKPPQEGLNYDETGTISEVLSQKEYIFGDETQLKLVYDIDGGAIDKKEQLKTAWKFPVDTDNNGKFDSFTLYGIYFRNPLPNENRPRSPLEARARPQAVGVSSSCEAAGNGAASDTQGWYETDGQLKKAFFTYVANVPITQVGSLDPAKYEPYTGNKSFSALEMQQDQGQISLDNNAVWYNDDLVISNVPTFRLNGRIHTNSNLMLANNSDLEIIFYQVSSPDSCYYNAENAKIIVGGHVVAGDITGDAQIPGTAGNSTNNLVKIHLFNSPVAASSLAPSTPPGLVDFVNEGNSTTSLKPAEIATNSNAYETRLNALVNEAMRRFPADYPNLFPDEVKTNFQGKIGNSLPTDAKNASILKQVLTTYFAERLRRVSYKEVPVNADPLVTTTEPSPWTTFKAGVFAAPVDWMLYNPANSADLLTKPSDSGPGIELEATIPPLPTPNKQEPKIGDRISVGNSLPRRWWNPAKNEYTKAKQPQDIPGAAPRQRVGLVEQLDDLGDTSRGGYWERAAALSGDEFQQPAIKELAGGLRVVTGAGIYIDGEDPAAGGTGRRGFESFLPPPPTALELQQMATADPGSIKLPKDIRNATPTDLQEVRVVWPDTMPMSEWKDTNGNNQYDPGEVKTGDLQMRATVVYHSDVSSGPNQKPIACIATLYNPTSAKTAQNLKALLKDPDHQLTASPDDPTAPDLGLSINGLNYAVTDWESVSPKLYRQAHMIFPDGRWVNKPLRDAVLKASSNWTIADKSAIHAANCALKILENPAAVSSSPVPDFAIKEEAFLDARQIKAIHKRNTIANSLGNLEPLKEVNAATVDFNQYHRTKWESISNPDKQKIADLGELNFNFQELKKQVPNYPFYSLPIEQRQPLEIRVTQIDLDQLKKKVGTDNYLLPNSGIIYASRDDSLPDISDFNPDTDGDKGSSATDFLLDPTRRPNGILLVKGANLARKNTYDIKEKGLILATDLPVYIKSQKISGNALGGFNLHLKPGSNDVQEEFTVGVTPNYENFYTRVGSTLNKEFAVRPPQNGATLGDQWRAARILSDAVTLLSSNFRFGYRNEADYDLNNNIGNLAVESRLKNGFWWNAFATNGEWVDPTNGYPKDFDTAAGIQGSTYVTNGVTPIQRRAKFPEYKMEICRKLPVAACGPGDWKATEKIDTNNDGVPDTDILIGGTTAPSPAIAPPLGDPTRIRYVAPADRRYPRRVAFQRNNETGELIVPDACTGDAPANCKAVPIGTTAS